MFGFSAFAKVPFADIPATTPSGINYSLTCAVGTYSVTGKAAAFSLSKKLTTSVGSYNLTGIASILTYLPGNVPHNYTLTGAVGSYALTGKTAALTVEHKLTANVGSYSVTGKTANFSLAKKLTVSAGEYAVTGNAATFSLSASQYSLFCENGEYLTQGYETYIQYYKGIWAITSKSAGTWNLESLPTTNWDLSLQQVRWVNDFSQVNAWLNDSGIFVLWGTPPQSQQTTWQQINNYQ